MENDLRERSGSVCELCTSNAALSIFAVSPKSGKSADESVLICSTCKSQIENPDLTDANHWRCLNDSMWNTNPPVQVLAWRMLNRLREEGWPQDLLDMLYLDDDTLSWAKSTPDDDDPVDTIVHKDSNGAILEAGDSVILIKDLNVKGANFTAKRGTAVRNISLVHDNPEHIEGKVNGQQIVILTKFVKK